MENFRSNRDFPDRNTEYKADRYQDRNIDYPKVDNRRHYRRQEDNERAITDADIVAIVEHLEKRFTLFLGKAIWAALQKIIITLILALLVYGYAFKGIPR